MAAENTLLFGASAILLLFPIPPTKILTFRRNDGWAGHAPASSTPFSSFFISFFSFFFSHSIEDWSSVYVGAPRQTPPYPPATPLSSFCPLFQITWKVWCWLRPEPFGAHASVQRFASGATILWFADDMSAASLVAVELHIVKVEFGNVWDDVTGPQTRSINRFCCLLFVIYLIQSLFLL